MGGSGSGNRSQYGRRTVESCRSIDVRQYQRLGLLVEGGFQLQWKDGPVRSVWVTIESGCMMLAYDYWRNGQWENLKYTVPLTNTGCNFGGRRYWFICPAQGCSRRAAILYLVSGYFACRSCHRLAYRMQHVNAGERGLIKAQRIRMKLGGTGNMTLPFPPKPKHMRWTNYYRLRSADQRGNMRWIGGLQAWLDSRRRAR